MLKIDTLSKIKGLHVSILLISLASAFTVSSSGITLLFIMRIGGVLRFMITFLGLISALLIGNFIRTRVLRRIPIIGMVATVIGVGVLFSLISTPIRFRELLYNETEGAEEIGVSLENLPEELKICYVEEEKILYQTYQRPSVPQNLEDLLKNVLCSPLRIISERFARWIGC